MHREKLNDIDEMKPVTFLKVIVTIFFIVMHVGALAAFWFLTWQGVLLATVLYVLTGLGVTIGYHRLLTHKSFETYPVVRAFWGLMGSLSMQSDPVHWVSFHRKHHQFSDKKGDPHSPLDEGGLPWAHQDWVTPSVAISKVEREKFQAKYSPDLLREPMINAIRRFYLLIQLIFFLFIAGFGWLLGGWYMMLSFLSWNCFRTVLLFHVTWSVNSASHKWGYKNYLDTGDDSRNNPYVAVAAFGEGWHNNHHKWPRAANHGQKPGEFDLSYKIILLMGKLGLAWDINTVPAPPPLSEQK